MPEDNMNRLRALVNDLKILNNGAVEYSPNGRYWRVPVFTLPYEMTVQFIFLESGTNLPANIHAGWQHIIVKYGYFIVERAQEKTEYHKGQRIVIQPGEQYSMYALEDTLILSAVMLSGEGDS